MNTEDETSSGSDFDNENVSLKMKFLSTFTQATADENLTLATIW